jgi:hypothetical protein
MEPDLKAYRTVQIAQLSEVGGNATDVEEEFISSLSGSPDPMFY